MALLAKVSHRPGVVVIDYYDDVTEEEWYVELWPDGARGHIEDLEVHINGAEAEMELLLREIEGDVNRRMP